MNVPALPATRAATDIPPEDLVGSKTLTETEKIAEGARQFEALLLRQILQESQKTVLQSKFADNSTAASIYRDLVTNQLAESISKSGNLGLAKSLERQLTRQLHERGTGNGERGTENTLQPSQRGIRNAEPGTEDGLSAFPVPPSAFRPAPAYRP